ncbi:expansin EXLX1 family cellulose-binding protein [Plantactinospora sp. B5E13]|uniref:expansin EXLX1 family cellulose-binding protein n=1 Tax=Plantactinospora sp. B5E13 TaxID=3153758 RepID=UPI00325F3966
MIDPEIPDHTRPSSVREPGGAPEPAAAARPGGVAGRRRWSGRWLAGGGAALLAAVLGVVLFWVSGESAACAAAVPVPGRPAAPVGEPAALAAPPAALAAPPVALAAPPTSGRVYKGKASHYDGGNSGGNCSFPGPPANRLYAAVGSTRYAGSAACGSFLDVTGPKGTVRVMVLDRCAGCTGNKIDLSKQAFKKIADLSQGIVSVSYRLVVDPPVSGPLTFRVKGGASQYWFAVQVGNHGNPLKSVAVRRAGAGWRNAKRQPDNYWVIDGGLGKGPYEIRVTDVHGNQAVATGITLEPRKQQRSRVRLYGDGTGPTPTPSASASAGPGTAGSPTPPTPNTPAPGTATAPVVGAAAGGGAPCR